MDPAEVRRRNMVSADQMPFENRLGWVYDSGDYVSALDRALEMVGYGDVDSRREEARAAASGSASGSARMSPSRAWGRRRRWASRASSAAPGAART